MSEFKTYAKRLSACVEAGDMERLCAIYDDRAYQEAFMKHFVGSAQTNFREMQKESGTGDFASSLVVEVVHTIFFVLRFQDQLDLRFRKLGTRMAELETQVEKVKGLHYAGVWGQNSGAYEENDIVTHGGGMWICLADKTTDKPGTSDAWQLCVKRGRDGKSARR